LALSFWFLCGSRRVHKKTFGRYHAQAQQPPILESVNNPRSVNYKMAMFQSTTTPMARLRARLATLVSDGSSAQDPNAIIFYRSSDGAINTPGKITLDQWDRLYDILVSVHDHTHKQRGGEIRSQNEIGIVLLSQNEIGAISKEISFLCLFVCLCCM